MRRIYASLAGWEEGGYPYIPTRVPWWPYYSLVYTPVCLPGYTLHTDLKVDVMAASVRAHQRDGDEA